MAIGIHCKTAVNRVNGRFPYKWDLNLYRGCGHGCRYCFALYSHDYMVGTSDDRTCSSTVDSHRFFDAVYVKKNLPDMLERQLSSPKWKGDVINLGGITDNYQPCEEEHALMPAVLQVLIKYRNPCIISTKSDLILRDFDLFDRLSRLTYVNIASTITCADENLAASLEPGAASPARRFAMLKAFGKTNAVTGVHTMPVIPFLTDGHENLQALYEGAVDCRASYLLPAILNLRGRTREVFFDFIWREYPDLLPKINVLYENTEARKCYKQRLYRHIRALAAGYRMPSNYMVRARIKMEETGQNAGQDEKQLTFL